MKKTSLDPNARDFEVHAKVGNLTCREKMALDAIIRLFCDPDQADDRAAFMRSDGLLAYSQFKGLRVFNTETLAEKSAAAALN